MRATITKIDPLKSSRNGNSFYRIYFKGQDGNFYWSDICPDYRNYQYWKPMLKVNNVLDGLILRTKISIDADSRPRLIPIKNAEQLNLL